MGFSRMQPGPDARHRAAVQEIAHQLTELSRVTEHDDGIAPHWLAQALTELFGLEMFCAYRPTKLRNGACGLGERASVSPDGFFERYEAIMARLAMPFRYDPLRPDPSQRNRVRLRRHLCTHGPNVTCIIEDLWPEIGIGNHDQIRLLVSEGSTLLGWVGGFREQPFDARDERAMQALAQPLRRALSLRRKLMDASVVRAGVDGAVGLLSAAVFVADAAGKVQYANSVGADVMDRARTETRARLVNAIAGRDTDCQVARLTSPGERTIFLVLLREPAEQLERRLAIIGQLWGTTPRELEVLRRVVVGDSNKEIALRLKCHEGNVERHVTSLLRKSRCDSRSRMVARFWTAR